MFRSAYSMSVSCKQYELVLVSYCKRRSYCMQAQCLYLLHVKARSVDTSARLLASPIHRAPCTFWIFNLRTRIPSLPRNSPAPKRALLPCASNPSACQRVSWVGAYSNPAVATLHTKWACPARVRTSVSRVDQTPVCRLYSRASTGWA